MYDCIVLIPSFRIPIGKDNSEKIKTTVSDKYVYLNQEKFPVSHEYLVVCI